MNPTGPLLVAVGMGLAVHTWTMVRDQRRISRAARSQIGLVAADDRPTHHHNLDVRVVAASVGCAGFGVLLIGPLGILAAVVPWMVTRTMVSRRQRKRHAALDQALGTSLQLVIDQLRVGRDLTGALTTVADSALFPLDEILSAVLAESRLGVPLHEAIEAVAQREQNHHFDVIASAIGLHAHHGGALTEILATVAQSIEAEDELRREVETLTAEGRLSAQVLMGLPVAALALLSLLSPGYAGPLFTTSAGHVLTGVAVVLGFAGWVWLRALSQPGAPL